jgi:transposase InsO family protein
MQQRGRNVRQAIERVHRFQAAAAKASLRLTRTRPYRPQTNGKAERFIQTLTRQWAYATPYPSS